LIHFSSKSKNENQENEAKRREREMLHQAKMQNCALAVAYQKTASFVALA
jgi:hypothetical protein